MYTLYECGILYVSIFYASVIPNAELMLAQHRRQWANISPASGQYLKILVISEKNLIR